MRDPAERLARFIVDQTKRRDHILVLAGEFERHTAGSQYAHVRAEPQQVRDERRCLDDLLEVVEHEEQILVAQECNELLFDRYLASLGHGQRMGNGRSDPVNRDDGREIDEARAVPKAGGGFARDGDGGACFADAAGTDQGHEADVIAVEQPGDASDLTLASDKRGERERQEP